MINKIFNDINNILKLSGMDISNVQIKENLNDYTMYFHNTAVIKFLPNKTEYLYIRCVDTIQLPDKYTFKTVKSLPDYLQFEYDTNDTLTALSDYFLSMFINSSPIQEPFGCCHNFILCSDALKCIHPDPIFSSGCMYRENLEQGKVFYGKNRNI